MFLVDNLSIFDLKLIQIIDQYLTSIIIQRWKLSD